MFGGADVNVAAVLPTGQGAAPSRQRLDEVLGDVRPTAEKRHGESKYSKQSLHPFCSLSSKTAKQPLICTCYVMCKSAQKKAELVQLRHNVTLARGHGMVSSIGRIVYSMDLFSLSKGAAVQLETSIGSAHLISSPSVYYHYLCDGTDDRASSTKWSQITQIN